jgi:hypothetical protein
MDLTKEEIEELLKKAHKLLDWKEQYAASSGRVDALYELVKEVCSKLFKGDSFTAPLEILQVELNQMIATDKDDIGHPHNGALLQFGKCFNLLLASFLICHPDLPIDKLVIAASNRIRNSNKP